MLWPLRQMGVVWTQSCPGQSERSTYTAAPPDAVYVERVAIALNRERLRRKLLQRNALHHLTPGGNDHRQLSRLPAGQVHGQRHSGSQQQNCQSHQHIPASGLYFRL